MVTQSEAQAILSEEADSQRFERFCNRVIEVLTGNPVLGTAAKADLGADGRALQLDALGNETITTTSLRKDVEKKVKEDAMRLRDTHKRGVVYFCTSQRLSEKAKMQARTDAKGILGKSFQVNLLSQEELAELAERYPATFEEYYAQDVQQLRSRIAEMLSRPGGNTQLQIAHALTSPEGLNNRDEIADLLIIEVLAQSAATPAEVGAALQSVLRMPSAFPRYIVTAAFERLEKAGRITVRDGGRFELSQEARAERNGRRERWGEEERQRRERFAREVMARLGYSVAPDQLNRLWEHLMREMSVLLMRVGARFVALVEAARDNQDLNDVRVLASDTVRTACRSAAASIRDARVRDETQEALFQALLEVPVIAFEWLEQLIGAWLTACQLGFVPEVSRQLQPAVRKIVLGLDTDIVLSMLCEAEPDNSALNELLAQWGGIGGKTVIVGEVLREVAYHAWIARIEFAEITSVMRTYKYDAGLARSVARNAFVRSFWASGRPINPGEFDRYIRSYAGTRPDDTSAVEATIRRVIISERIAEPTAVETQRFQHLEPRVKRILARAARFAPTDASGGAIEQDKMDRDAASIVKYAASAHATPDGSLLVLSSSKRLRLAVRQAAAHVKVIVAPTSTLGLLLAACHGPAIRPQSIAQLLLAEGTREQVGSMRSELVRMLARADLLGAMPRARIVSLEREVETAIEDYAKSSARSRERVRREVLAASDKDVTLTVLSQALRNTAIAAEADRLMKAQAEEIIRLHSAGRAEPD